MNGSERETYLGLSDAEVRAIVEVVDGADPGGGRCSGVFVRAAWVVTAKHCLAISSPKVVVMGNMKASSAIFRVVRPIPHPTADVALLEVEPDDPVGTGVPQVTPFGIGTAVALGDLVEMAGFGLTLSGRDAALAFLVEAVAEIDATRFTVDGAGRSGACQGDSGGPLLIRAANGAAAVIGVLSVGSGTCLDLDRYARLDTLRDWIESVAGPGEPHERACGTISGQGRCLYGSAVWCSGGALVAETCASGTRCGWDMAQSAYRCVLPSSDPCDGVDSIGACLHGDGATCSDGVLEWQTCSPCSTCRVDARTGRPTCKGS